MVPLEFFAGIRISSEKYFEQLPGSNGVPFRIRLFTFTIWFHKKIPNMFVGLRLIYSFNITFLHNFLLTCVWRILSQKNCSLLKMFSIILFDDRYFKHKTIGSIKILLDTYKFPLIQILKTTIYIRRYSVLVD